MDLMIAVLHLAAVINVRLAHWATARERKRPGAAAGVLQVSRKHAIAILQTVAGRDAIAEVEQTIAMQTGTFGIGQHPDTDAVPIGRIFCSARMEATRLAAIFNIHA